MYTEFDSLSQAEKNCYQSMLRTATAGKTHFVFGAVDTKTAERAFRALLADNPQLFWFSGAGTFTTTKRGGVLEKLEFDARLTSGIRAESVMRMSAECNRIVDQIVAKAKLKRTVYEQVLFVHDYIIDTTDYDLRAPMCYNAYGCLVDRRAVCAGYAQAFMWIMKKLGYVCGYAAGYGLHSGESHAWNYIRLDNEFYFIDTTWDDPLTTGDTSHGDNKTMQYFCLTTEELLRTHRPDTKYHIPRCTGTKYNYYTYNNFVLQRYTFEDVARIAQRQLRTTNGFTVKFTTPTEAERAIRDLITAQKVYSIPGIGRQITYSRSKSGLILTVHNR